LNIKYPEIYFHIAIAKLYLNSYPRAIVENATELIINPLYAEVYTNLGVAEYLAGNFSEAIDALSYAIALNPLKSKPYLFRGIIHMLVDFKFPAQADLTKSHELGYREMIGMYDGQ
jgi:tetratricopeptide (TPR) repeat protein